MDRPRKPPPNLQLVCFELIKQVELDVFVNRNITGALRKIEDFFLSIGWMDPERTPPRTPGAVAAEAVAAEQLYRDTAYASRSEYPRLIGSNNQKIVDSLFTPERQKELEFFAKSIHAMPMITCSVYIEYVLLYILNHSIGDDLDACVKLIFCIPMKERYLEFMDFVRPRSTRSGTSAMNNFRSFMFLSRELILKKIDFSILVEKREMPLIDITFFLSRMYGIIQELLRKIDYEGSSDGIDILIVNYWFDECNKLKKRFEQNIVGEMRRCNDRKKELETRRRSLNAALEHMRWNGIQQDTTSVVSQIRTLEATEIPETEAIFRILEAKFKNLQDETQPLIVEIVRLDRELKSRSRPGTPLRPGGGGGSRCNRVKRNYSKTKKYKKNSTLKKCKKNYSKMKRCKKNFY
jgi:hypothetical protein